MRTKYAYLQRERYEGSLIWSQIPRMDMKQNVGDKAIRKATRMLDIAGVVGETVCVSDGSYAVRLLPDYTRPIPVLSDMFQNAG